MSDRTWRRAFRLLSRREMTRDVDAELRFHMEERTEELVAKGMSRAEAQREVARRFGDVERVRGELESIDGATYDRRARGEWLDALARDARLGVRALRRTPGFTIAALLTLALAIGANTAIFSAVNAVLLRPLPTRGLDRLVIVQNDLPAMNLRNTGVSPAESEDLFARRDLWESAAAWVRRRPTLTGVGEPRQLASARTMGEFWRTFEVQPLHGRLYRAEESAEGAAPVAVLSHAAWQELLGGDPAAVGRRVELGGTMTEIVGVLPADFRHPQGVDVYQPLAMTADLRTPAGRSRLWMTFVGRMQPGVTSEGLRSALDVEARRWNAEYGGKPANEAGGRVLVTTPFVEWIAGKLQPVLRVLMGAVALVLLVACANVASLQLVRAAGRAKEIAVRAALGARRGAVVRQLLVESVLLALAGGAIGLLLGNALTTLIARVAPAQFPQLEGLRMDAWVLAFAVLTSIAAGIVFGVLPAISASRVDLNEALKEGAGRGASQARSQGRLMQGSVVLQVALALVLLLGSTLVLRGFARLLEVDPGFRADGVATLKVTPPATGRWERERGPEFYAQLLERVRRVPGVEAAGAVYGLPFAGDDDSTPFDIPWLAKSADGPERHAEYRVVSGEYFRAMGIPVKSGRVFAATEGATSPNVVVIDESLVRDYFPAGVDPVGREIRQLGSPKGSSWTVVGVVSAVMRTELGEAHKPTIYYLHSQVPWYTGLAVTVRTSGDPAAVAGSVRAVVRELEPAAVISDVRSMEERLDASLGARRLAVFVLGGFAALAFVLAVLGIYGVIAYGTAQRGREISIRLALGATAADVTRMIVRQGVALAAVGLLAGVVAWVGIGPVLQALVYGVEVRDPLVIASVALVLAAAAGIAAWVPGRRAGSRGAEIVLRG